MLVKQIYRGVSDHFSHLIECEKTKKALVIDPVDNIDPIISIDEERFLELGKITLKIIHKPGYTSGGMCLCVKGQFCIRVLDPIIGALTE